MYFCNIFFDLLVFYYVAVHFTSQNNIKFNIFQLFKTKFEDHTHSVSFLGIMSKAYRQVRIIHLIDSGSHIYTFLAQMQT